MLILPVKFLVTNIFMLGVTTGAIGTATAIYVLSDPERRKHIRKCIDKVSKSSQKTAASKD